MKLFPVRVSELSSSIINGLCPKSLLESLTITESCVKVQSVMDIDLNTTLEFLIPNENRTDL